MSEFLTPAALPAQDGGQSLQNRLRELRSRLEPGEKGHMLAVVPVELYHLHAGILPVKGLEDLFGPVGASVIYVYDLV